MKVKIRKREREHASAKTQLVPKTFTKDNPCTKVDIWNAFITSKGLDSAPVVRAQSFMGVNAPRNMLNNGYVTVELRGGVEYYELTEEGEEWLIKGLSSRIKRHPDELSKVKYAKFIS